MRNSFRFAGDRLRGPGGPAAAVRTLQRVRRQLRLRSVRDVSGGQHRPDRAHIFADVHVREVREMKLVVTIYRGVSRLFHFLSLKRDDKFLLRDSFELSLKDSRRAKAGELPSYRWRDALALGRRELCLIGRSCNPSPSRIEDAVTRSIDVTTLLLRVSSGYRAAKESR